MSFELLKPPLRTLRGASAQLMQEVWGIGFAVGGAIRRPQYETWHSPGGQRVLVIAPHPDDETIGCAGVIVRHGHAGDKVSVAFITDGRGSRAMGLGPQEMAERRLAEAAGAMHALNVTDWKWLGLPEGDWNSTAGKAGLQAILAQVSPDLIYAPSRVDFHPEHARVAQLVAECITESIRMRIYPIQVPLTPVLANCIVPVQDCVREIRQALDAYASQRVSVSGAMRLRRYTARRYGIPGVAEEFCEMSGPAYTRLHAAGAEHASLDYYGLRYMPFTDPLAYWRGTRARLQVKNQVH